MVKKLKMKSRKCLLITSLGRLLLIPAFNITGIYGSQGWMIFLMSVLGLSNGYLTVCVITSAPYDLLVFQILPLFIYFNFFVKTILV